MEKTLEEKIESLKKRGARRKTKRYSEEFKRDALRLVNHLKASGWTQQAISKSLGMPWVTFKRWQESYEREKPGGFRPVKVVDRKAVTLVSPSGWRIEGLTLDELVEVAGRL